jgi:sodium-dependent dicarboxylate transporter 2/3/5
MVLNLDEKKRIAVLIAGFIILAIFYFIPSPDPVNYNGETIELSNTGKMMLGILVLGVVLWVSEAIPLAITGLLVMILQPILLRVEPKTVFTAFGNTAVFFLIGAFIIAAAIEKQNLHKRIALSFLKKFESSPKLFIFGILLCSALLSFIMPNHAVAVLMLPIVLSILISLNIIPRMSNFGKVSMLSIAFGCSIGSIGTLIGGARNPLTIGVLEEQFSNTSITFLEWMVYCIPIVLISLPFIWLILISFYPPEVKDLKEVREKLAQEITELGPMRSEEKTVTYILVGTVIAWIIVPSLISNIGLAVIGILGGVIMFFSGTITWRDIERRVPWGIILLYGGAITLGVGMVQTGAAKWLAIELIQLSGENPVIVIIILILITVLFTNVMSNTAAVAMILPIGLGFGQVLGFSSPILLSLLIASAGGFAFLLVVATPANAITYSAGYFSTKDLIKVGVIINLICILILFIIAVSYWYLLGLW